MNKPKIDWYSLPKEVRGVLKREYLCLMQARRSPSEEDVLYFAKMSHLEELYGKENLMSDYASWEGLVSSKIVQGDVTLGNSANQDEVRDAIVYFGTDVSTVATISCRAYLRIDTLRNWMYQGSFNQKEWENVSIQKWAIVYVPEMREFQIRTTSLWHPIAFRSRELAGKFLKHNKHLLREYYGLLDQMGEEE